MLSLNRRATRMAVESVNSSKEPEHGQAALIEGVCECGALKIYFSIIRKLAKCIFKTLIIMFMNSDAI